jgi:hypothetical protein
VAPTLFLLLAAAPALRFDLEPSALVFAAFVRVSDLAVSGVAGASVLERFPCTLRTATAAAVSVDGDTGNCPSPRLLANPTTGS